MRRIVLGHRDKWLIFYFPQLTSGAYAQYPLEKTRAARTIKNLLADGSMIVFADPGSSRVYWQLAFAELSMGGSECPASSFRSVRRAGARIYFIDPAGNMLAWSSDLNAAVWSKSGLVGCVGGAADPVGTSSAFTVTNNATIAEDTTQTLSVPANYHYCFSVYAKSAAPSSITLVRAGHPLKPPRSMTSGLIGPVSISAGELGDARH